LSKINHKDYIKKIVLLFYAFIKIIRISMKIIIEIFETLI